MKKYYILRNLDSYGSAQPVCVTRPDFDEIWTEATASDIMKYGTED